MLNKLLSSAGAQSLASKAAKTVAEKVVWPWLSKMLVKQDVSLPVANEAVSGIIVRHPRSDFGHRDRINVPAGYEAIHVTDGTFSAVYREGDSDILGTKGDLYFIRLAPVDLVEWGLGNVKARDVYCGLFGSTRMEVTSSRKALSALMGQEMPVSVEAAFDRVQNTVLDAVRQAAAELGAEGPLSGRESALAARVVDLAEEPLEELGLKLTAFKVEPVFIPEPEEEE